MPLNSWTCDMCGDQITDPEKGLVISQRDGDFRSHDFKIVHKNGVGGPGCDPGNASGYVESMDLADGLGLDGQSGLLGRLSAGPIIGQSVLGVVSMDEFVDLFRRLQTPWYEEARPYLNTEHTRHWLGDANESYPYTPQVLEKIANQNLGTGA